VCTSLGEQRSGRADAGATPSVASRSELPAQRGKLLLKISGAAIGETMLVSSSVDLLNWVPWLTDFVSARALEALVPWDQAALLVLPRLAPTVMADNGHQ